MTADVAVYALRVAVATTFALAVAGKGRDLPAFARTVTTMTGMRLRAARPLAAAVVAVEAAIATTLLLWPGAAAPAFWAGAALLGAFGLLLVTVLRRPHRPACNCFGTSDRPVSGLDVVRNALLIAAAVAGATLAPGAGPPALGTAELALVALPAVVAGVAVAHLHDVATTLRRPLPDVRLSR